MKKLIFATVMAIALSSSVASAQTPADDPRHPPGVASPRAVQTQAATPTPAALSESTIKALQEALNKQGITLKVDGVLNDETRAAIRKYQSQHHLAVTGEPDKATLDKLGVRQDTASTESPTVGQTTPTPPAGGPSTQAPAPAPQAPIQQGQMQGGMMNCPMMPGMMQMMQGMMQGMQGMMQTQPQPGQQQPGQMQPGMMQMMQGMMQMMQGMQAMMQSQMQPGQTPPMQMQPGAR